MFFTLFDILFLDTGELCVNILRREKRGKSPYQKRVSCVSFLFDITVVNFCFSDINSTRAILLLDNLQVSITISLRFFSLSFELDDWPIS
jgi:DNA primase large subunit